MDFDISTRLYHENNCVLAHSNELCALGTKALIVTGRNSSRKNGSLDDVTAALATHNIPYVVFDKIEENPSVESVIAGAQYGASEIVDFVIGIGGGSPLDASKAIALLIANGKFNKDFLYTPIPNAPHLPIAAVPTTCGTGSVLTLHSSHTKKSISHQIFPEIAFVDSKYLKAAPDQIITSTALDALAHLCESFLHAKSDVKSRKAVEKGLTIWGEAKNDLADHNFTDDVLDKLMSASVFAGIAIRYTGTSIPHGLSYRVTYECKMAHGLACAVFLPPFIENAPANCQKQIMEQLGFNDFFELKNFIARLCNSCEIPRNILELSIGDMLKNKAKLASACYPIDEKMLRTIAEYHC